MDLHWKQDLFILVFFSVVALLFLLSVPQLLHGLVILKLNGYGPVELSELQWTKETHDNVFPPAGSQTEGQAKNEPGVMQ